MTRRAAKVDQCQPEIVDAFRTLGFCVLHTHQIGKGAPDLIVGRGGKIWMVEVKQPKGKLTPDQEGFHRDWPVHVVRSVSDVVELAMGWRA